ncbi:hypothetical protein [Pleurocapsa sp. PCC 7319]|uniref:ATP-binding protein n=1 Tax=Pleurocapsa sp. PCC 7319 TaxID=118161 RepID=UPI001181C30A|nr:hypothetical protein [Pleurocapsa sp. PCC 7319]
MKVLRTISIEVLSDLKALDRVLSQFNQIYLDFIPDRDWLQCRLTLAVGFTNAGKHAYQNLPINIPIRIEALPRKTDLEIQIWDYGFAFALHSLIAKSFQKYNIWLGSGWEITI